MLVFPLMALPLVAFYLYLGNSQINRPTTLWNIALGILAFLPTFLILSVVEGNGLKINWTNPLFMVLFYFFDDFLLPVLLSFLAYHFLAHCRVLEKSSTYSIFFYLAFFASLIATRVTAYHYYFGLYELIVLPFIYIAFSFLLAMLFSNLASKKLVLWSLMLSLLCIMPSMVAYLFASNHKFYGLIAFIMMLALFSTLYFISKARHSLSI